MKKLQNNYTTPEQSKRLLELGVPADSADCLLDNGWLEIDEDDVPSVIHKTHKFTDYDQQYYTPCWSVGRLIEIMNICSIHNIVSIYRTDRDVTQIDIIIETIINRINGNSIDFSKLEAV